MPRKQRNSAKSVADRFEPANESIVCPLHGSVVLSSNGHSQVSRQGSVQSNGSLQNGHSSNNSLSNGNGQLSRKSSMCSNGSASRKMSQESSYESAHSSTTLRSHLAQPEEVDEYAETENGQEEHVGDGEDVSDAAVVTGSRAECTRFTRQALYTYRAKNHLIHYKYSAYGGNCHDLPR